ASHGGGDANLRRFAAECLIECNFHVVAQVRSALAPRAAAACGTHAEYAFEDVGKSRAEIGTKSVAAHATMLECSVAESVVGRALVAVLEDVIGLVDFLETVLTVLVARIAVRMVLHGELAERCLELDLSGGAAHAENFVVVALRHPAFALI